MSMRLDELAQRVGASLLGQPSRRVSGCASLEAAGPEDVSFLANPKYAGKLKETRAGAVILSEPARQHARPEQTLLIADDAYFAFREAMVALVGFREHPPPGISEHAWVSESAKVGEASHVGPYAVIADDARIGARCVIYPHVYLGPGACVGEDCVLFPGVCVYDRCVLGDRVTLHAGCSIGQDGFGYATHGQPDQPPEHHKIPQGGNAVVEDDVEMGAHCSVDRATVGSTVVGRGSKFSNAVTIGHGSKVGPHNLLVAQVGLAGSVTTGAYVAMGGQAGVAGHLHVGDQAQLAAKAGVMHDLPGGRQYGGAPAQPLNEAKRQMLAATRLPDMTATLRRLEKRVAQLEAQLNTKK